MVAFEIVADVVVDFGDFGDVVLFGGGAVKVFVQF
jgi:hypothetical protein